MLQLHPDDRIWRNLRLATLDPDHGTPYGLLENMALIVRAETILAIVPESDLPRELPNSVDLQGRLVTPGLIDCHTHWCLAAIAPPVGAAAERRLLPDHQRPGRWDQCHRDRYPGEPG